MHALGKYIHEHLMEKRIGVSNVAGEIEEGVVVMVDFLSDRGNYLVLRAEIAPGREEDYAIQLDTISSIGPL
jgi:hypothetical protein